MPEIIDINDRDGGVEVMVRQGGLAWGIILSGQSAADLESLPEATALAQIRAADNRPPTPADPKVSPLIGKSF